MGKTEDVLVHEVKYSPNKWKRSTGYEEDPNEGELRESRKTEDFSEGSDIDEIVSERKKRFATKLKIIKLLKIHGNKKQKVCHHIPREHCKLLPKEHCSYTQECWDEAKEKCLNVPKLKCWKEPKE